MHKQRNQCSIYNVVNLDKLCSHCLLQQHINDVGFFYLSQLKKKIATLKSKHNWEKTLRKTYISTFQDIENGL